MNEKRERVELESDLQFLKEHADLLDRREREALKRVPLGTIKLQGELSGDRLPEIVAAVLAQPQDGTYAVNDRFGPWGLYRKEGAAVLTYRTGLGEWEAIS